MPTRDLLPLPDRFRLWGETLLSLAEPDRCERVVQALNDGDRDGLERLIGERIFAQGGCIDVVETLTHVANFSPVTREERCEVVIILRPPNPSATSGKIYRMPDGRYVWLSEAEWWAYADRAAENPAWLKANHDLLLALGIIACHWVDVPSGQVITVERERTICFPTVVNPFDVGAR